MPMDESKLSDYFSQLATVIEGAQYTASKGLALSRAEAFGRTVKMLGEVVRTNGKVLFCGNGGSAGICSHMSTDFFKNGKIPALALNDSSALTCLGNDYGFEYVFSKQIEMLASQNDIVVAVSSSGQSQNILNAVESGRQCGSMVVTYSGFAADNPLRQLGDANMYISESDYGVVEIAHLSLIHALLDFYMGWPNITYPD